jgi:RNA polymerase sigma-70 factor (ECF subfamily)
MVHGRGTLGFTVTHRTNDRSEKLPSAFATTQWTIVVNAGGEDTKAREALAQLCQAYWLPLYVYVRRRGYSGHDAEDLIQGFFADLLRRSTVKRADPARGRFRTFLLSVLVNYLHDAHDHSQAARRGGTTEKLSFDALEAADALAQVQDGGLTPDQAFDRSWTLALLDRAMKRLRAEQERLGKSKWFERVRPCLQSRSDSVALEAIAAEFGLTKNAVAVAIHRLATRYRELARAEIAETVSGPNDLQAEQRDLLRSLAT